MNTLRHLKGNFIVTSTAIGIALIGKHIFKKEFIPVSSEKQVTYSYLFILGTTIAGKILMDKFYENTWLPYTAGGKPKVENEGFIGPLSADLDFIGPPHSG